MTEPTPEDAGLAEEARTYPKDATGLPRGASRLLLHAGLKKYGLDATALSRGVLTLPAI